MRYLRKTMHLILASGREKIHTHTHTNRTFIFIILYTATLCTACSESPEQMYQRLDTEAQQHLTDQQFGQAISTWKELLSRQPDAPNIYSKLAKTYELSGQYPQALRAFQQHYSRHPESQETALKVLQTQLLLLDIAGARTTWEELKPFPSTALSLILHGDLLASMKQDIAAIEEYKKALTREPSNQVALARLAVLLRGLHKIKESEKFYQDLERRHPESPEILLQMGNYWLLTEDRKRADIFLKKAIDLAPDDPGLQIKLAELYLDSGQFSQAASIFKQLLDNNPGERFYKKMLFESLLLSEQFTDAEYLLTALSATENQDVDFLLLKGKYYLNTGEYLVAASQFELALEKEPRLPLAHYFLGLTYLASGQNNLGQTSLIKCLTLNPYFTEAELTLADYYYKTEDYDLAIEHVIRIQEREPENFRSFLLQGNILLTQKKYPDALAAFQKAYILNQTQIAPLYYTGVLSSFTQNQKEALALYHTLVTKKPSLADATLLYTQLLCRQGLHNEALTSLSDAIAKHPDTPYLRYITGLILLDDEKKQEAIKAFKNALQVSPGMKETYLQLFKLYKNNSTALQDILIEAIRAINNFEEALTRLAAHYNANQQSEKSITLLEKALAGNPDSPVLANNLAWLYLEHQPDNLAETMRIAAQAYDRLAGNPAIADTLGWVYYKKNLPIRANWLLEEACSLEPDNPQILYHLAVVQLELDKKSHALKNLIKAKSLTDDPQLRKRYVNRTPPPVGRPTAPA